MPNPTFSISILSLLLLTNCNSAPGIEANSSDTYDTVDTHPELNEEQEKAFSTLNELQVSCDRNKLYSTFVGAQNPCSPPDTSFILSREQFADSLALFLTERCSRILGDRHDSLIASTVSAETEYSVEQCYGTGFNLVNDSMIQVKTKGTWIIRNILGRRDLILVW